MAERIAEAFSVLGQVEAVALAGSRTSPIHDSVSDWDIYVYAEGEVPVPERERILGSLCPDSMLAGLSFFEPGDELAADGCIYDIMYRDCGFPGREIERVWVRHQPSLGYSTAFLHNLKTHRILFDRHGFLARELARLDSPYPDELAGNIIAFNSRMATGPLSSSWIRQVGNAVARGDLVSINHRVAALMASYFDILFAANRVLHPGEKRLMGYSHLLCSRLPDRFDEDIAAIYASLSGEGLMANLERAMSRLYDMALQGDDSALG